MYLKCIIKPFTLVLLVMLVPASVFASNANQAGKLVDYEVNGAMYQGYLAKAPSSKGMVLIIHDWDGLTDYEIKRADMLAQLGYDSFAVDLYGKDNRPTTTNAKKEQTAKLYENRDLMRHLILSGLTQARTLLGQQDAVVMGYCFGGAAVLELARSGRATQVKGYASFHGGLSTPPGQRYNKDSGPLFIAHGGADTSITLDDVSALAKALENAEVTYDIEIYSGAPHAFTVFDSERYQAKADKKSWTSFIHFLEDNLG